MAMHTLYRHFDQNDELLYIGVTSNLFRRTAEHERSSPWFRDIARIDLRHFDSREDAIEAEDRAISNEKPKHNQTVNAFLDTKQAAAYLRIPVKELMQLQKAGRGPSEVYVVSWRREPEEYSYRVAALDYWLARTRPLDPPDLIAPC